MSSDDLTYEQGFMYVMEKALRGSKPLFIRRDIESLTRYSDKNSDWSKGAHYALSKIETFIKREF